MNERLERVLAVVLVLSAVAIAASFVRRSFFPDQVTAVASDPRGIDFVADWRTIARSGALSGPPNAPIVLIEFGDLECPFCKRFHEDVLPRVRDEYGEELAFVYVHYPIGGHRFAKPAARAAECAARDKLFHRFLDEVYLQQDSLGLKSWVAYGKEAGISDTIAFQKCVASNEPIAAVDTGTVLGDRIGITGTPTIILNGWRFASPPTVELLMEAIEAVRSGRKPFEEVN